MASAGTVNALFRLGDTMVVRLPLRAFGETEPDLIWLPRLAPVLPVAVPEPLFAGAPSEAFPAPWGVYRWLDGTHPVEGAADGLAEDLAGFVRVLSRLTLPGAPSAYRGGPLQTQNDATLEAIGQLGSRIDSAAVTSAWEESLAADPWTGPPVWLHADLMPGNLLVGVDRLTAVIDWGTLGTGDPACDLIPAWNLLSDRSRPVFRSLLDVDEATWLRGRGKALSMALIQLPYYWDSNPAMAHNARYVVSQVLAARRWLR